MTGIYKIENIVNKKIYIGSCSNFNVRKGSHLCLLRQGKHHSIKLLNSNTVLNFKSPSLTKKK